MPRYHKKSRNKSPLLRISLIIGGVAVLAAVVTAAYFLFFARKNISHEYGMVLNDYVGQLQEEGLLLASEIKPKSGGASFIHVLVPKTGEISDEKKTPISNL